MVSSVVFQFFTIVLSVLNLAESVTSRGFYSVQFLKYSNTRGVDEASGYCDMWIFPKQCELYFKITFRNDEVRKNFTSQVYEKEVEETRNVILFNSTISNMESNPFKLNFSTYQGHIQYFIEVWDFDDYSGDDKVESLSGNISLPLGEKWKIINATRKEAAFSFLQFQVKAECYPSFYGNRCSIYCLVGYNETDKKCNSDNASNSMTALYNMTIVDSTDSPVERTTQSTFTHQMINYSQPQRTTTIQMKHIFLMSAAVTFFVLAVIISSVLVALNRRLFAPQPPGGTSMEGDHLNEAPIQQRIIDANAINSDNSYCEMKISCSEMESNYCEMKISGSEMEFNYCEMAIKDGANASNRDDEIPNVPDVNDVDHIYN